MASGSKVTALDGEARTPVKTAWWSTVGGVIVAGGLIAFAVWNHFSDDVHGDWLFDGVAAIFTLVSAYTILSVWTSRWRLLPDRIEVTSPFRERTLPRAKVTGYRVLPSQTVHLESADGPRRGLGVPLHVAGNPAWGAWFETLNNLDAVDYNAELAVLEKDARLGSNPTNRLETLDAWRRRARLASLAGLALAGWLWIYPRPYEAAVAVNVLLPLVALTLASRFPGLITLVRDQEAEPTVNLGAFWFAPSGALAVRAMLDIQAIDWVQSLGAGFALAAIPFVLALRAEQTARRPGMAVFSAVILLAWGYGTVSLANVLLDRAPPTLHPAVVVDRSGSADDDPALSLRLVGDAADLPVMDFDVSARRFDAAPIGSSACVALFPGRLGWRYAVIADCPTDGPTIVRRPL